jgi:DNA repair exonuclease SbcCD nuclease subunit
MSKKLTTILHTADLHLKQLHDERWQALETILNTAQQQQADVLTIAGDLFDQDSHSHQLRDQLRPLFAGQPYKIVILPGNHDARSFETGLFFGENVEIIHSHRQPIKLDSQTTIVGLPFTPLSTAELAKIIEEIEQQLDPKKHNILLFHGELTDLFFNSSDFGDEGNRRYLPLRLSMLSSSKLDYVLAGHFHTQFHLKKISNQRLTTGGFFVYPGSPVSITTKEIGLRSVVLVKLGETPKQLTLDTHHYQTLEFTFQPEHTQDIFDQFTKQLAQLPAHTTGLVSINGYFDSAQLGLNEQQLRDSLINLINQHQAQLNEKKFAVKDISTVLSSDLYQAFSQQLQAKQLEPDKIAQLTQTFIAAITCQPSLTHSDTHS